MEKNLLSKAWRAAARGLGTVEFEKLAVKVSQLG